MKKTAGLSIVFLLFSSLCYAQYIIKGQVADEQLQPLQGVNISIGKKILPVITDSTGHYSFSWHSTEMTLSFTYVGHDPASIKIKGENAPLVILVRNNLLLSDAVVNSFESNSSVKNTPAAITVLNKASLQRYSNESFVPAMNTVPGVKMDERSPGSYRLSIRGNLLRSTFGVRNVKIYWNGIPLTDASGNTYFNQVAFNTIGRIEILKGPSGSMYGSGTGGVVLLKSDFSSQKEKSISIQSVGGSYGLFNSSISYDQSGKNSNSSLSFAHQQSDGYRRQTEMRRDMLNYSGSWTVNSKQDISANIFYSDLYYQTPGGLTQAELAKDPRQARPAAGIFNSAEAQQAALYVKTAYAGFAHEYRFDHRWSNTTSVYLSNTNFRNPTIRNYERKTEQGIGTRSVTKYRNGIFTGVFGGEYQYGFNNTSTFGNKLGQTDTLQFHDEINSRQFNVFVQADINLPGDMIVNAGISYNNFHYGFTRLNELPVVKQESDFTPQLVPRISFLKKIKNRMSVYASVSKGYSPPSIDEVHASDGNFNRQLNAETAINYEAGIKGDIIRHKLSADICYYIYGLRNTIVSRRDASGADYYVNAGKTRQRGLEASLNYFAVNKSKGFIRDLVIRVTYTNIHARFRDYEQGTTKFNGNKLTGTPPNVFTVAVDLNTGIGLYSNLTYCYTDIIPLNDANTFFASAYNLFFAKLGWQKTLSKTISTDIFVVYNKSFNEPFSLGNDLNAAGNRYFNPSAPETISGGVKMKFTFSSF